MGAEGGSYGQGAGTVRVFTRLRRQLLFQSTSPTENILRW